MNATPGQLNSRNKDELLKIKKVKAMKKLINILIFDSISHKFN